MIAQADFQIALPYPPSVNRYWRHYRGRVVRSKAADEFRNECIARLWTAGVPDQPFRLPCRLEVALHPPDRKRRDIDNVLKATLDVLQLSRLVLDDHEITELEIRRRGRCDGGALLIRLIQLEN